MPKVEIPDKWELGASRRYKKQDMDNAMRGRIERGLVELITNSDDSYRNLEEEKQISGKIIIGIERKKMGQPSTVIVRDRAEGMNREEMYLELGEELGKRTSGFEKGKPRRGLHGRGARDVAAFGTVHFESIKEDEYNHLIIPPSLICSFTEKRPRKVTDNIRSKMGIPRGNGTVVTIEVANRFRIPQHEKLLTDFSRYYSLRDLFSNQSRELILMDLNRDRADRLLYKYPDGKIIFDNDLLIPDYPEAKAHLKLYEHSTPFEQGLLPYREGVLLKSSAAIHDCTYFGLESEPLSWRITGQLYCEFIDQLIREYDDREDLNPNNPNHPANNPQRLLVPSRDGLMLEHQFARSLYKKCKDTLQSYIEQLKNKEKSSALTVTTEHLDNKLKALSREVSKVFESKLKELEEDTTPGPIPKELSVGLHIIPPEEQPIVVNQPKTFSVIVKHYEALDDSLPVNVISGDPDIVVIRTSPVFLKSLPEDEKVGRTTFTVEGSEVGAEVFIEVRYGGYENLVLVKVIEPSAPPPVPDGLSFEKPLYYLQVNKEKTLAVRLKTAIKPADLPVAEIVSAHPDVVVKGGGKCKLNETDTEGVFHGQFRVLGQRLKAQGRITASVEGFVSAQTGIEVVEKRQPPSGIDFKPPRPVEEDFISMRYKWDAKEPYLLLIGASHPSIRRYLGEPTEQGYPGKNSPLYHTVLAEVVAEALAFYLLEKHFKREGQQGMLDYDSADLYYHKQYSEFLSITHNHLVELI
jgi:hypothetical protein